MQSGQQASDIPAVMTKEDEIPDWVAAQEFYDKYEPKEILGRWALDGLKNRPVKNQGSAWITSSLLLLRG